MEEQTVFAIEHEGRVVTFGEQERPKFIATVDSLLRLRLKITVEIAAWAVDVVREIRCVFEQHGIRIHVVAENSDPEALDYVANLLAGAVIGGMIGGVASWLAMAFKAQVLGPQVGIPLAIIGAGIGAVSGIAATQSGYRILARFRGQSLILDASPL